MTDTEDLRAASRALKDAISGLSRALGQGLADVGADVGREIATELNDAARELSRELSGAAGAAAGERKAQRSVKAERTRADLLAAARTVFAERGYEAASVSDLAKAAGYTKGALYAHFASKEELFVALVREANEAETEHGNYAGTLEDWVSPDHGVTDVMLSLEAYLYAQRHPESRPQFVPMAESSLRSLARQVHHQRTGEVGEPTRDDNDTAMALAACYLLYGIIEQILPPEWDVMGAFHRTADRLVQGGAPGGGATT